MAREGRPRRSHGEPDCMGMYEGGECESCLFRRERHRRASSWELAEARDRRRHAAWLVAHGASVASVADEFGVSRDTVSKWARRYADGAL